MSRRTVIGTSAAALALLAGLTGCASKDATTSAPSSASSSAGAAASDGITVDASDTACTLSATKVGVGKHSFSVTNSGTKVTEFYVYGPDGAVLDEVENISPGLRRTLDVDFSKPGTYRTACKPGMVGDGISAELTVTG